MSPPNSLIILHTFWCNFLTFSNFIFNNFTVPGISRTLSLGSVDVIVIPINK